MQVNLKTNLLSDFYLVIFPGQAEGSDIQGGTFDKETNKLRLETSLRRYEAILSTNGRKMEGVSALKHVSLSKTFYATYVSWQ